MTAKRPDSYASQSSVWGSAAIGFEFAAAIGGFALIGFLIDRWQGTGGVWTLSLAIVGFIGGTYNLFKEVRKLRAREYQRPKRGAPGEANPRAAAPDIAATRGRPRPTGRVDLFARESIPEEELEHIEIDWPDDERDEIEDRLRGAQDPEEPKQ